MSGVSTLMLILVIFVVDRKIIVFSVVDIVDLGVQLICVSLLLFICKTGDEGGFAVKL